MRRNRFAVWKPSNVRTELLRKHFDRSNNVIFCSYEEMFSRLPGKVSRCNVDFVKCKQKFFPLSGKVVFIWDENCVHME